jgi:hypothetical protein
VEIAAARTVRILAASADYKPKQALLRDPSFIWLGRNLIVDFARRAGAHGRDGKIAYI